MASAPDPLQGFPLLPNAVRVQLATLLHTLDVVPRWVDPVTSVPPWRPPAAFRIGSTDGRVLKVRVGDSARLAARSAALMAELADPGLNPLLGRVGRVTAERWVEGRTLSEIDIEGRHLDAAGALLRRVHAFPGTGGERLPQRRSTSLLRRRTLAQVDELVTAGLLAPVHAASARRLIGEVLPRVAPWGIVHTDVCGQNLVVGPGDRLVCIDNERLGRGFFEADLARTWYRWPMAGELWARLEGAYRCGRLLGDPEEERAWRCASVLRALHMRHRRGAPTNEAVDALTRLV